MDYHRSPQEHPKSRADLALDLADKRGVEVYRNGSGPPWVTFEFDSRTRDCHLGDDQFTDALIGWVDEEHGITLPRSSVDEVLHTLSARARRINEKARRFLIVCFRDEAIGNGINVKQLLRECPFRIRQVALTGAAMTVWGDLGEDVALDLFEREGELWLVKKSLDAPAATEWPQKVD